jgi:hypothetical protein
MQFCKELDIERCAVQIDAGSPKQNAVFKMPASQEQNAVSGCTNLGGVTWST